MTLVLATSKLKPGAPNSPSICTTNSFEENLLERELEAEICQRFVRLSCEKMLASRLSEECSSLLKRHPQSSLAEVSQRIISSSHVEKDQNEQNSVGNNNNKVYASETLDQESQQQLDDLNSTTTLVLFDNTTQDLGQQQEDNTEYIYLSQNQPHVSRILYQDQCQEEKASNVELDVELEHNSEEDYSSPMEDVNIKIDGHIFVESSIKDLVNSEEEEYEEIIDVVGDGFDKPIEMKQPQLSPIGSHLHQIKNKDLRGSHLRSYSSSCFLQEIGSELKEERKSSDVIESASIKASKFSVSSSSSLFSFSSSSSTTMSPYQYEIKEEPLEYKVQDRHENHKDYGFIDFSQSSRSVALHSHHTFTSRSSNHRLLSSDRHNSSNYTNSSSFDSLPHYTNFANDEEEFQKQQRRHFSGRLYERCNFTRLQPSLENNCKFRSGHKHKAKKSVHSSSLLLPFNNLVNVQMSRLSPTKWPKEVEEEAIEEGTDAAELDKLDYSDSPPLPLRSSSEWFTHRQLLPNIQSIMAAPLSPPMNKHINKMGIMNELSCGAHSKINNACETPKKEEKVEEEADLTMLEDECSGSPPNMFYCSPPSSPPSESESKSTHLLVFHYSEDEEDEDFTAIKEGEEEGFFEEEEDDEEEDKKTSHGHIRKRKTTGNGKLAVLEKRPCCDGEDGDGQLEDSKCEKEPSDGDSGVDVNGALSEDAHGAHKLVNAKPDEDQTVPVAVMLSTPLMFV